MLYNDSPCSSSITVIAFGFHYTDSQSYFEMVMIKQLFIGLNVKLVWINVQNKWIFVFFVLWWKCVIQQGSRSRWYTSILIWECIFHSHLHHLIMPQRTSSKLVLLSPPWSLCCSVQIRVNPRAGYYHKWKEKRLNIANLFSPAWMGPIVCEFM